MSDRLEFRILGPLEVLRRGAPVTVGSGMQHTLLALLVLRANEVVSSDRLIDELWGAHPPESGATALHGLVSQLRKALEPGRPSGEGASVLVTRAPGYELVVDPEAVDATTFERLLQSGRAATATGDAARGRRELQTALALWRGDALADAGDVPTVHAEATRLEELRLDALEARIDADLALGRHAELVPELEALVQREPLRERLCAQLMLALYRSGRQADALDVYRRTRETLVGELGLEPTPGLRELEHRILQHDPGLAAPPPAPAPAAPARRGRRTLLVLAAAAGGAAAVAVAGAVWLLHGEPAPPVAAPGSVAVVDPAKGRVVDTIPVGAGPAAVAFGHGSVWVASADDRTLTRIDPETRTVEKVIGIGKPCVHLAVGPDAVWVANGSAGTLTRIDPESNTEAATIDLSGTDALVRHTVHAVAVGEGAVWAAVGPNTLVRLDARTNAITGRFRVGAVPVAVAAGLGSVWVGVVTEHVLRVDPRSGRTTARVPVLGWPYDVAIADRHVLVSARSLSAIEPVTATPVPTPRIATDPVGVADVPGPGAWTAELRDGDAVELTGPGESPGEPIPVGRDPSAIAFGAGLVWVTVREPGVQGASLVRAAVPRPASLTRSSSGSARSRRRSRVAPRVS